jgi:hypothetical protein
MLDAEAQGLCYLPLNGLGVDQEQWVCYYAGWVCRNALIQCSDPFTYKLHLGGGQISGPQVNVYDEVSRSVTHDGHMSFVACM